LPILKIPRLRQTAVKIMAARSGVSPGEYLPLLKGTKLLTLEEGKKVYVKGDGYQSIYGFLPRFQYVQLVQQAYGLSQNVSSYIDPSFTMQTGILTTHTL